MVYIIIMHSLFVIICIAVTAQVRAGVIRSDIVSKKAGTFFAERRFFRKIQGGVQGGAIRIISFPRKSRSSFGTLRTSGKFFRTF